MTQSVGRIVNLECHRPPPVPVCAKCVEYERAIREHQRAHEAARSFVDEAKANLELWKAVGL
jgi:hypothetical protein